MLYHSDRVVVCSLLTWSHPKLQTIRIQTAIDHFVALAMDHVATNSTADDHIGRDVTLTQQVTSRPDSLEVVSDCAHELEHDMLGHFVDAVRQVYLHQA